MFSEEFRTEYLKAIGISPIVKRSDLLLAYETAHRIREFEIDLYWKRTAYIWAMQAALIAIVVFLHLAGDSTTRIFIADGAVNLVTSTTPSSGTLTALLLVSTLAFVIAGLWYLLIAGAKFWQDNWERHVDILGTELGQNLYQVYPISNSSDIHFDGNTLRPFSVTKINSYLVCAFVFFWVCSIIWAIWQISLFAVSDPITRTRIEIAFVVLLVYFGLFFFSISQFKKTRFYDKIGMGGKGLGCIRFGEIEVSEEPVLYSRECPMVERADLS